MNEITSLLIALLMLLGNGFFVGAEFSLIAARRSKIEPIALSNSWAAKLTLAAMEQVSLMLAGAQLGVTVCSLVLGYVSEPVIAHLIEPLFESLAMPSAFIHPVAFLIAISITVYLHVVIGEMVPKNLALSSPTKTALWLTPPLFFFVRLTRPIVVGLNYAANLILRMFGVVPKREVASSFSRDEVAGFVRESHASGLLSEDEEMLLTGVLMIDIHSTIDAMMPLDKVLSISSQATPQQIEALSTVSGYSRFPIRGKSTTYMGYVHLKDVVGLPEADYRKPIDATKIRSLNKVTATDSVKDSLKTMQKSGSHMAKVLDSRGVTIGLVSIEDLVEDVIGQEIIDETDQQ